MCEVEKYLLKTHYELYNFTHDQRNTKTISKLHFLNHSRTKREQLHWRISITHKGFLLVTRSKRKGHTRHERLTGVLYLRSRVCGHGCVRIVCRVCSMCRKRRVRWVWGDGWMTCMWTEGQRRSVDVVVVHHRTRQDQLQQTGDAQTQNRERNKS